MIARARRPAAASGAAARCDRGSAGALPGRAGAPHGTPRPDRRRAARRPSDPRPRRLCRADGSARRGRGTARAHDRRRHRLLLLALPQRAAPVRGPARCFRGRRSAACSRMPRRPDCFPYERAIPAPWSGVSRRSNFDAHDRRSGPGQDLGKTEIAARPMKQTLTLILSAADYFAVCDARRLRLSVAADRCASAPVPRASFRRRSARTPHCRQTYVRQAPSAVSMSRSPRHRRQALSNAFTSGLRARPQPQL